MLSAEFNNKWGFLNVYENTAEIQEIRQGNFVQRVQKPVKKLVAKLIKDQDGFEFTDLEKPELKAQIIGLLQKNGLKVKEAE